MAKEKELTYDSAKEKLGTITETLKTKREEFLGWLKEKGLKKTEDHSKNENEKVAKKYTRLKKEIEDLEAEKATLKTFTKDNKPKKDRTTKYAYPEGATADDKKKFRQAARVKAKAAGVDVATYLGDVDKYNKILADKQKEKDAKKEAKAEKKEKKADKAEKGAEGSKKAKADGDGKKKKKPKVEETEEEDEDED